MEFFKQICGQMIDGKNTENKNEHRAGTNRIEMIEQSWKSNYKGLI